MTSTILFKYISTKKESVSSTRDPQSQAHEKLLNFCYILFKVSSATDTNDTVN